MAPLNLVYFHGPRGMGFWNGREAEEACSELTRVPAQIWHQQQDACKALLAKDFTAFCIGGGLILAAVVSWKCMDVLAWRLILRNIRTVHKEDH